MDNMLVIKSTQKEIDDVKYALTNKFKMSDFGPVSWYLELKITYDISAGKMFLLQALYIKKILEHFGMQQAKGVNTPIVKQNSLIYTDKKYKANNSTIT